MTGIDWVLAALVLLSALVGLWRGLIFEVLSLLGWIAAFFVARWLAASVGVYLPLQGLSDPMRYAAGFALTFIAALLAAGLLAALVRKVVSAVGLRPIDRVLLLGLCAVWWCCWRWHWWSTSRRSNGLRPGSSRWSHRCWPWHWGG
jgi:membrane protein required for colicin V production